MTEPLRRDDLHEALGDNPRLIRAFEDQARVVTETAGRTIGNAAATEAIQEATVIVLSHNAAFTGERVLRVGEGIEASDDGEFVTLRVSDEVVRAEGGFRIALAAAGDSAVGVPISGVLATTDGLEALTNKTLAVPIMTGLAEYADDAAAAVGGVPVGGLYLISGALHLRVA